MKGDVKITKDEYLELLKAKEELMLLEIGGVDNWEWYGESLNPSGEIEFDVRMKELEKKVEEIK